MPTTEVRRTTVFDEWLRTLKDRRARAAILSRLDRLAFGLFGDIEPVGAGVSELRVHYGPGYRVYLTQRGPVVVVLLCGGDKSGQARDIKRAKKMAREIGE